MLWVTHYALRVGGILYSHGLSYYLTLEGHGEYDPGLSCRCRVEIIRHDDLETVSYHNTRSERSEEVSRQPSRMRPAHNEKVVLETVLISHGGLIRTT